MATGKIGSLGGYGASVNYGVPSAMLAAAYQPPTGRVNTPVPSPYAVMGDKVAPMWPQYAKKPTPANVVANPVRHRSRIGQRKSALGSAPMEWVMPLSTPMDPPNSANGFKGQTMRPVQGYKQRQPTVAAFGAWGDFGAPTFRLRNVGESLEHYYQYLDDVTAAAQMRADVGGSPRFRFAGESIEHYAAFIETFRKKQESRDASKAARKSTRDKIKGVKSPVVDETGSETVAPDTGGGGQRGGGGKVSEKIAKAVSDAIAALTGGGGSSAVAPTGTEPTDTGSDNVETGSDTAGLPPFVKPVVLAGGALVVGLIAYRMFFKKSK
jgi:hypothetical protein